jgi:uncharacterized membrane protein
MRKSLEAISLAALASIIWITFRAFYGPSQLPDRIPIHFDATGVPNGWGPSSTLLFLPVLTVALYLFISVVAMFPAASICAGQVTEENRAHIGALTLQMVAWLKVETVCFLGWIQWSIIQFARQGHGHLSPLSVLLFLVAVFGTAGWYMVAVFRAARHG